MKITSYCRLDNEGGFLKEFIYYDFTDNTIINKLKNKISNNTLNIIQQELIGKEISSEDWIDLKNKLLINNPNELQIIELYAEKKTCWNPVIQNIFIHSERINKLRFGYYLGEYDDKKQDYRKKFISRPLEIPEEYLIRLVEGAIKKGVLKQETINKLKELIKEA